MLKDKVDGLIANQARTPVFMPDVEEFMRISTMAIEQLTESYNTVKPVFDEMAHLIEALDARVKALEEATPKAKAKA
jgi:hypothetical protein